MTFIVLAQAGIPEAGLALIFAVDRPLDMCRTIVNITGDATVSMIVAKSVGKVDDPKVNNCLLYTSPSSRDRTRPHMPSSA